MSTILPMSPHDARTVNDTALAKDLGKIWWVSDGCWRLVKATAALTACPIAGASRLLRLKSTTALTDTWTVELNDTAAAGRGAYAGFLRRTAAVTAGQYVLAQIAGMCHAIVKVTAIDGKELRAATAAGDLAPLTYGTADSLDIQGVAIARGNATTLHSEGMRCKVLIQGLI